MITSCCFDIETSSLDANFGIILCAVIQGFGAKPVVLRGDQCNPNWDSKRSDDSDIVRKIVDELLKFDVLVAHYGSKFDLPFIRTRMAKWHLGTFPNTKKLIDPYHLSKNKFCLRSNSLESLSSLIGAPHKTIVDGQIWIRAALDGDKKAMDYIVKHCIRDVKVLGYVVDSVKGYSSTFNSWGSGF